MLRAALGPTARVAHLPAAATMVGLAVVPTVIVVLRGDGDLHAPMVLAAMGVGAALGWACDDPPAELLGSMPVSTPVRGVLRLAILAGVVGALAAVVLVVLAQRSGLPVGTAARLPEALAAAAVACAVGQEVQRRRAPTPGQAGVLAGLLGPATLASMAVRWPAVLPGFLPGPAHGRWWWVVAAAGAVAARAGRDPATPRRGHALRHRRPGIP